MAISGGKQGYQQRGIDTLHNEAGSGTAPHTSAGRSPSTPRLLLPALKEKMMRMKIGAYRNTNTNAMKMRFPSRCFRFHSITACSLTVAETVHHQHTHHHNGHHHKAIAAPSWGL